MLDKLALPAFDTFPKTDICQLSASVPNIGLAFRFFFHEDRANLIYLNKIKMSDIFLFYEKI